MIGTFLQGVLDTQANFILAAAGVCGMTALTLVLLTRNADIATFGQRMFAALWIAVVAGAGVWTTHFVAMIGYRPDAALTYDLALTFVSIVVGILAVGLPIAASLFFPERSLRAVLGTVAGLGVAAMHLTGMSAIENCLTSYNPLVLAVGIAVGVTGFVTALLQDETDPATRLVRSLGMVGGVCGLHFVAMASVSLSLGDAVAGGIGGSFLSILVAVVSLGVFAAAIVATFNHRRTLALMRAGF